MSDAPVLSYKHAASVTGQVFFCAAPIRLDAYDGCQFGCVYCFSRKRARQWNTSGIHAASTDAFQKRLARVKAGDLASALDEFLAHRVPVQLGGLHDPFTARERDLGITHGLLTILRDYRQPTLISTKGDILLEDAYIGLLKEMDVAVRFSAAALPEAFRSSVDRRTDSYAITLKKIERLSRLGIPTGLRLQPVLPGFEADALRMTRQAARAGVQQVSFEYLKLSKETLATTVRQIRDATGVDMFQRMKEMGRTALGWDYTLTPDAKRAFVREARKTCRTLGIRFGAGDTEFIPWSDGDGCCGSSSDFVGRSRQFKSNFVGAIKAGLTTKRGGVAFRHIEKTWSPERPVSTYLQVSSRNAAQDGERSDWVALMAKRWNGDSGPYSPAYFDGVIWNGQRDENGMRIYDAKALLAELAD